MDESQSIESEPATSAFASSAVAPSDNFRAGEDPASATGWQPSGAPNEEVTAARNDLFSQFTETAGNKAEGEWERGATIKSDGTEVEHQPDGSVLQRRPDGTASITRSDGSGAAGRPDGSVVFWWPNGGNETVSPRDGTITTRLADGSTTRRRIGSPTIEP